MNLSVPDSIHKMDTQPHLEFKIAQCSPTADGTPDTCYTVDDLFTLRDAWNARHPDCSIDNDNPQGVWKQLRSSLSNTCANEKCWARKLLSKSNSAALLSRLFAPEAPQSWCKKPTTWLDSRDISRVMSQYEDTFPVFKFFGPAPIDFAGYEKNGSEVWPELKHFSLKKLKSQGKNKIGIILNTDPHDSGGRHWISLYVNLYPKSQPYIFFFDSNGDPPPGTVVEFMDKVVQQAKQLPGRPARLAKKVCTKIHQKGDTECGIYSLFMIDQLLKGTMSPGDFQTSLVTDKDMHDLRTQFFSIEC